MGLFPILENLPIQTLVPELIDEALNIAILPGTARVYEDGLTATIFKPPTNRLSYKLRPVITISCSYFTGDCLISGGPNFGGQAIP